MKTKFKMASIISMLFALLAFMPKNANAQCVYQVFNGLNCPVTVQIDVYTPMPQCPLCISIPMTIPPGGIMPFDPCSMGCPAPFCNIKVTVNNIGGIPVPAASADFTTLPPGNPIPRVPAGCSPSGTGRIMFDGGNVFRIQP